MCSCDDRVCGNDGCGGSCGDCPGTDVCTPVGQCVPQGTLQCIDTNGVCNEADACLCVTCVNDGTCTTEDDCVCPDCAADAFCSDPNNCNNDGICDFFNEGCACADCTALDSCTG